MNAGYHVELAGGGYNNPKDFEIAIRNIASAIPPGRGITCNLIYVNPRAMSWQIAVIRQLIRSGIQIDGLTIGAGIPSPDIATEYIKSIGLKHISFKPGSYDAILEVIAIAKMHPNFPVGLQWTGGRAGGHHSFEDFHDPILRSYGRIRHCSNIVLIAGSGFGGAPDTYPYITGTWSHAFDYPSMPFDGVLFGSRMMVAKEAHTALDAKSLIVQSKGVRDSEWHKSYEHPVGGVVTVNSEMGQPIHKLATRGVMLWKEMDITLFNIKDPIKRLQKLKAMRTDLILRLNRDFSKPWFGIRSCGEIVDVEEMTYMEVLTRLVDLMYVRQQKRWIHPSYQRLVIHFLARAQERLTMSSHFCAERYADPFELLDAFSSSYVTARKESLYPEDVSFFMSLCRRRGQKPVNFIPILDENFETWFKKDSLWQSEDLDAVIDGDAQRVCIIHGPVAASHSKVIDEPVKTILDTISRIHVEMRRQEVPPDLNGVSSTLIDTRSECPSSLPGVVIEDGLLQKIYRLSTKELLPDTQTIIEHITSPPHAPEWLRACLRDKRIRQGNKTLPNPILSAFSICPGDAIVVSYQKKNEMEEISLSSKFGSQSVTSEVLTIRSVDGKHVAVQLLARVPQATEQARISFLFTFTSGGSDCRLVENILRRNERIKSFYADMWIRGPPQSLQNQGINSEFRGEAIKMTRQTVENFMQVIARSDMEHGKMVTVGEFVPLDFYIVTAWESLVKPLLISAIDGDLLKLLHRSNSFEYYPGAQPLRVGEMVETTSRISSITIQQNGKLVEVSADIKNSQRSIMKVTSSFLILGDYHQRSGTFQSQNLSFDVDCKSPKLKRLIASRPWLVFDTSIENAACDILLFRVHTQTTYSSDPEFFGLHVVGQIFSNSEGSQTCIGRVYFEHNRCCGNPVVDFLEKHGAIQGRAQRLESPGWATSTTHKIRIPGRNEPYSMASGDNNPIHVNHIFARYAGLPGTVTHGMFTSAAVRRIVEREVAHGDSARFRKYSVSFEGKVLPDSVLRVQLQHVAMIEGRLVIEIQAFHDKTEEKVLQAEAEIEQAPTTYLFCGQGCQEKGMGMTLYDTNEVSKALWDRRDTYLKQRYGFSLLEIVRNDPKILTIHFRGKRGRQIRDNYLSMTHRVRSSTGEEVENPVIAGLTADSTSYTFKDERGLLFSTQFAQPALLLMEIAELKALQTNGLVQMGSTFAGHSLGEYSALGALTTFMPLVDLLNLVFYRGLHMQNAMKRNQFGHTDFAMLAVNPSRIGKNFAQPSLESLVDLVSQRSEVLLEIVNYNVEQQQYVCAGHLRALWLLSNICNHLATLPSPDKLHRDDFLRVINNLLLEAKNLTSPIELVRGTATIPLSGIDVPFHSTYLRGGIDTYRHFLHDKIMKKNVDPDQLVGKWIPNITGTPFSIEKSYIKHVMDITGSKILQRILEN